MKNWSRWGFRFLSSVASVAAFGVALSFSIQPLSAQTSCAPVPAGLVGWWAGEGNANDNTTTNNGVLEGGVSFVPGEVGQAFSFDGVSGSVVVPDSISLRLTNQITIECWINPSRIVGDQHIAGKLGGSGGINGYELALSGSTLFGQFNNPGQPWPGPSVQTEVPISTGVWNHVAWTYDQSAMRLYWNGSLVATHLIGANAIAQSSSNFQIGGVDSNPKVYFSGLIDEVSVYNVALSAAQIQTIFEAAHAGKCFAPVLPYFQIEPADQTVNAGQTVNFTASAGGTPPLAYQWQFDGTNLAGATTTLLMLANVQAGQAGVYSMVVSNAAGSVSSTNAALVVNSPPPCTPVSTGLVSWWRGQGDFTDHMGANDGALQGGVAFVAGEVGQAFLFDGVSGSVIVPDSVSLRLTNQITIECWINTSKLVGDQSIAGKVGGSGGNNGYQLGLSGSTLIGQFNSPGQAWPQYAVESYVPIVAGAWNHVAWTYDQSLMKLYWNGSLVATHLMRAAPIAQSSSDFQIGAIEGNPGVFFDGLIDEVSVYNVALSAAQIQTIFEAAHAGKCVTPVLPYFQIEPADQTVYAGQTAVFTAGAAGTSPLGYQWRFNGTNLSGATTTSLILTNVQAGQAGVYSLVASNEAGSGSSSNATLVVNPPPPCIPAPSGLISWWRAEGNANDAVSLNNGALVGGVTFADGEVGTAFDLDGSSQYVDVPDSPSLNPTRQVTIEAGFIPDCHWIRSLLPSSKRRGWGRGARLTATSLNSMERLPSASWFTSVEVRGGWHRQKAPSWQTGGVTWPEVTTEQMPPSTLTESWLAPQRWGRA